MPLLVEPQRQALNYLLSAEGGLELGGDTETPGREAGLRRGRELGSDLPEPQTSSPTAGPSAGQDPLGWRGLASVHRGGLG